MIKKIVDNLKYIKIKDFLTSFIFLLCLIPALFLKLYNKIAKKEVWLICENKDTARDNGYHFFKYIRTNYPNDYVYYAIDKKSSDYNKIKEYGNIIQFGSIKHWIYYLSVSKNISTQKAGNPLPWLFYILHVYLNLFNNRVFLQHGVIKDDLKCFYYNDTKFIKFICGAKAEYDYILEKYGYPKGYVEYTGLARFDNLHDNEVNKKQILIMPTWRNWLGRETNVFNKKQEFKDTTYFKKWNNLLNNERFNDFIQKNNITVYFYPHVNMHKFLKFFNIKNNKNIRIVDNSDIDIQKLLKESALMITDYSSVYMDFAYMKKPVIYYQFDKEEYRQKQHLEGYFKYEENGFGPVLEQEEEIVNKIISYINKKYNIEKKYLERMKKFYLLHDKNNCERIYKSIKRG